MKFYLTSEQEKLMKISFFSLIMANIIFTIYTADYKYFTIYLFASDEIFSRILMW